MERKREKTLIAVAYYMASAVEGFVIFFCLFIDSDLISSINRSSTDHWPAFLTVARCRRRGRGENNKIYSRIILSWPVFSLFLLLLGVPANVGWSLTCGRERATRVIRFFIHAPSICIERNLMDLMCATLDRHSHTFFIRFFFFLCQKNVTGNR